MRIRLLIAFLSSVFVAPSVLAFSFTEEGAIAGENAAAEEAARAERIAELVSVPCRRKLKGHKIMVVIAERTGDGLNTSQRRYSQHFQAINLRLRALGLRTYTQEEIRRQIAQAEIDAHFRNDPDAAINASKKLGASFILRGLISTQTGINPVLRINEVAVNMDFTLVAASGMPISSVSARADSYAGTNTIGMALTLVNEQADELVAQLYNDFCLAGAPVRAN